MRAGISILILIAVSTGAFADDSNVYNDFLKWMKSLPNATVDEQVTALIKRHMANLLYPVDMCFICSTRKGREISRANYGAAKADGGTTDRHSNL